MEQRKKLKFLWGIILAFLHSVLQYSTTLADHKFMDHMYLMTFPFEIDSITKVG